jgi:hypothetical protein
MELEVPQTTFAHVNLPHGYRLHSHLFLHPLIRLFQVGILSYLSTIDSRRRICYLFFNASVLFFDRNYTISAYILISSPASSCETLMRREHCVCAFWKGGSRKGHHVESTGGRKSSETTEVPNATASSLCERRHVPWCAACPLGYLSAALPGRRDYPAEAEGVRRMFSEAPWVQKAVVASWLEHGRAEMRLLVEAERAQQQTRQPTRCILLLVTGEVHGVASTRRTLKGRTMEGRSTHHSPTSDQRIGGHSMVQGLSVLLGRRCHLVPQVDRQTAVCDAEEVPFQRTSAWMNTFMCPCQPVAGTNMPIVVDRWPCATCLWHTARERNVLIFDWSHDPTVAAHPRHALSDDLA